MYSLKIKVVADNSIQQVGKSSPLPQVDSIAAGDNYFYRSGTSINTDQGDLKLDYNFSDKDHAFFRWSQGHLRNPSSTGCIFCASGSNLGADQPMKNAVLNWTHAFSSELLTESRVGFNAVQFNQNITPTTFLGHVGQELEIARANLCEPVP